MVDEWVCEGNSSFWFLKKGFKSSKKRSIQFCNVHGIQHMSSPWSLSCFVDYKAWTIHLLLQNLWMIGICFRFELKHMLLRVRAMPLDYVVRMISVRLIFIVIYL